MGTSVETTYPELAIDPDDKTRITTLFLQEVINHQTNSVTSQGWPSLTRENPKSHTDQVLTRLSELEILKQENLYTVTDGYRSRASSGEMDRRENIILEPSIKFIKENFRLEPERFEGLVKQLNQLDLSGKSDEEFKGEMMKKIEKFCEEDRLDEQLFEELEKFMSPSQTRKMGAER